jgi:hypothetical protein
MVNHSSSFNGPYMLAMSAPPQVNYATTCPVNSAPHEREYLPYLDLDLIFEMVISSIGILELYLPTLIEFVNMYSFQSVFLPSNKYLLETMDDVSPLTCIPSRALSYLKP